MNNIKVKNKLNAPHAGESSPLYSIISSKIRQRGKSAPLSCKADVLWSTEWWGLHHSSVFRKFSENAKYEALAACNRTILNEAYFIEKSGLAYSGKMVLLAKDTDTAQLYAHIGADEATHLAWIEPFVASEDKLNPNSQFLSFLSKLIEECKPEMLVFLVQIILEGWGLDHYKRLMLGCKDPALTEVLRLILKDEALHHHSGIILYNQAEFSNEDRLMLADTLKHYAEMVRIGPLAAVKALDKASGGLSVQEVEEVMSALDHPAESKRKLELLKSLMSQPGMEALVEEMGEGDFFTPLPLINASRYYLANR